MAAPLKITPISEIAVMTPVLGPAAHEKPRCGPAELGWNPQKENTRRRRRIVSRGRRANAKLRFASAKTPGST